MLVITNTVTLFTLLLLLLLLLLHLLDHLSYNCEKLVFHNNGIMMMNLLVIAALGSGELNPVCLQTALFLRVFGFDSTEFKLWLRSL